MKKGIILYFILIPILLLTFLIMSCSTPQAAPETIAETTTTTTVVETTALPETTALETTPAEETPPPTTEVEYISPIVDAPEGFEIARPIDIKYDLWYMKESPEGWFTHLESGIEMKAVFNGTVSEIVNHKLYSVKDMVWTTITLTKEGNKFLANYTFYGDALISKNDIVAEGDVLAISKDSEEYGIEKNFLFSVQDEAYNYIHAGTMEFK